MIDKNMSKTLAFHAEHYLIAVAEHLMAEGAAISRVYCCGPSDDPEDLVPDVEGSLYFGRRFARQLDGQGHVDLHWMGASGWCLGNADGAGFPVGSRWMGNGLLPEAERVAAFLDTYRLNPDQAGSTERPFYRSEGSDFPALLKRLAAYVPTRGSGKYSPEFRFSQARDDVYFQRVFAALSPKGKDPVVEVPLHASELEVLLEVLEYAQVAPTSSGIGDFAARLADDLEARRGGGNDAAERHRSALTEAADRRQRIEEYRRRQRGENG